MLFNEPKLLKSGSRCVEVAQQRHFSALQRAEIAEILFGFTNVVVNFCISVLFNEPKLLKFMRFGKKKCYVWHFSALQRAEIAEIEEGKPLAFRGFKISVLFNEPKLLKSRRVRLDIRDLFRFQCSSTSRNC